MKRTIGPVLISFCLAAPALALTNFGTMAEIQNAGSFTAGVVFSHRTAGSINNGGLINAKYGSAIYLNIAGGPEDDLSNAGTVANSAGFFQSSRTKRH